MHKPDRQRAMAIPPSCQREDLVASVAQDFVDLAEVLERFSSQRLDLDRRQLDCIARANAAAARGIELSARLSRDHGFGSASKPSG